MASINKIMCACGSGLGSSLIVHMNTEEVLKELGVDGVEVVHSTISDIHPGAADLFVVGGDLGDFIEGVGDDQKIVLSNILDKDELKTKLKEHLGV